MTVNYELTEEDWLTYQLEYVKSSGMLQKARRSYLMLFLLTVVEVLVLLMLQRGELAFFLGCIGAALLMLSAGLPEIYRNAFKKQLKRGDVTPLFSPTEITLEPKGIRTHNGMGDGIYYWSAVQQLVETDQHLYIRFSAAINIIIPKRAFATSQQGAQFLRMAEEYRKAATGTPIPATQRGSWWTQGTQVVETQIQRH